MNPHIIDITDENAQLLVLDESFKRIVVVDFWSEGCEICRALAPILDDLATVYDGSMLLAKINADEQQMLVQSFGIRSVPTVMILKDGQPIDGFTGAQSESEVKELIGKYLPKPWDNQLLQAQALSDADEFQQALPLLSEAYKASSQRADIAVAFTKCLISCNRLDDAQEVVTAFPMVDQDANYAQVKALLELALEAGKSPEIEALEKVFSNSNDDPAVAVQLAMKYTQNHHDKDALALLYAFLVDDLNCLDGGIKKAYTDILVSLPKGERLAVEYQRKLYTLLY